MTSSQIGLKFLLVRFSAIGDCVMASHAATSVKQTERDCFLAWAIEQRCAAVASTEGLVNLRKEFPRERWSTKRWSPSTWWAALATYGGLRKHRFDLGMDLQGHSKTALCLYLARPKKRIAAFATDALARRLNPVFEGDAGQMHVVEWNHQVLLSLGVFHASKRPMMPAPDRGVLERHGIRGRVVSIATGAGATDKQWDVQGWNAVGSALRDQGLDVVFVGGRTDPRPQDGLGTDLVGKTSLRETMSIVASSELHLAGDTGTGHIAAAYGVPVVSVFGPTDPNRYRPFTENGRVLRNGKSTRDVSVGQVTDTALEVLAGIAK